MKNFKYQEFFLLIFFTLILLFSATFPLSGDEAYYWNCSKYFDWSYFDQPPLVIWFSGFFSNFYKANFTVRIPSIIFTILTLILLYKWFKKDGLNLFLILSFTPLIFFGSFYLSTDRALSFFYLWATYILIKIFEKNSNFLWLLLGISFGFGFLSKFPMVLILPVVFYMACKKANLFQFFIFFLTSSLISSPVLIYGIENNWANFTFQLIERHKEESNILKMFLNLWLPNLILIGPFFFINGIHQFFKNYKKNLILFFTGAMPILFFTFAGLKNPGAPHWLVLGIYSIAILQMKEWKRKTLIFSIILNIFFIITFSIILLFPGHFFKLSPSVFENFVNYKLLKEEILKEKLPDEIIISQSYTMVSLLNYFFEKRDEVFLYNANKGVHGLSFLFWQKKIKFENRDYLLVSNKKIGKKCLEPYFESFKEKTLLIKEKGISKKFYIYHCRNIKNRSPFYPYHILN